MSWDGAERREHDSEILREVKSISEKLAKFQSDIDVHAFQLQQLFGNGQPGILSKHGERLRILEAAHQQSTGAKAVWSIVTGFIGSVILYGIEWVVRHAK